MSERRAQLRAARSIFETLEARDEGGQRRFAERDVAHAVPWLVVASVLETNPATLEPPTLALLGVAARVAGVPTNAKPEDIVPQLAGYYADNPPKPEIVKALKSAMQELLAEGGDGVNAFGRFLAGEANKTPVGTGERPAGTVPGGPLGRILTAVKDK